MNEYYYIGIIYLILLTVVLTLWRFIDDNFQKMQYLENGREADRYMENVHEILFSTYIKVSWYSVIVSLKRIICESAGFPLM